MIAQAYLLSGVNHASPGEVGIGQLIATSAFNE
jgi:hypothetical protein